ncbi:hypothetical protein [Methylomonas koyamae]|uniref:hypothetical protein n=1 Tax=Methylomonas koyamae TaxID=702114 RepID=UPI0012F62633|nr:hypothetical protein [Methylomonas koyamae]
MADVARLWRAAHHNRQMSARWGMGIAAGGRSGDAWSCRVCANPDRYAQDRGGPAVAAGCG